MASTLELPRYRLEALAAALSCSDFRLEISRVASVLGLSEQHTRLQLRRLRGIDEKLGLRSWALTDSRWLGLRPFIVMLGARDGPSRQLSSLFVPGHVPWWLRIHWLPLPHYVRMAAEVYGGSYLLVYRVPRRFQGELLDFYEDNSSRLGVKMLVPGEPVPVHNCSGVVASSADEITKTFIQHSRVYERVARRGSPAPVASRTPLLDIALYTVLEARPLTRYGDLDRVEVALLARGYPAPRRARLKTRLVQRHYNRLSASGHLGRAWLGPLLYQEEDGEEPLALIVEAPRECAEMLYAAVAATVTSPYIVLAGDTAFAAAYAPARLQREISRFLSAHCGGEAKTIVLTRYVTAPMPLEMYDPEEKAWSRTPRNPAELLRRYGLLQPLRTTG